MSDITNSIRLNDYMSSTLRTINHTMEQTIRIMEKLGRSLELLESSSQGGFRNLENGLKAIMARAAMLQEMIKSIGTGAGPSRTSLAPFQASLRIIQNQAAALAKQMENLNGFKGNNPLVPFIRQFEKALATAKQLTNAIKSITIANDPASTAYFNLLTQQINEVKQQIGGLKAMLAQINSTATAISSPFEGWTDQLRLLNHLPKLEKSLDAVKRLANAIGSISIANDSANTAYFNLLTQQINKAKQQINDLKAALSKVNNTTEAASNPFEGWMEKLKVLDHIPAKWKTAMEVLSGMGQIMGYAEIYADANAELDAINDGHRTQLELQRQVLRMANETGSSYLTSAAQVAQLGDTAQFQGKNDRTVRFVDIVYKSSILSGADSSETADVMNLLSQAMASGTLKGEGFNAVLAKSSKLAEAMAAALGVDITTLRQMAMEGTLTAATVAEAVLRQGEVIDAEFAKLPRSFRQNIEIIRNIMGFWLGDMMKTEGALGKLNQLFTSFVNFLIQNSAVFDSISAALFVVVRVVEIIASGIGFLMQIVEALGPVFDAVVNTTIIILLVEAAVAVGGLISTFMGAVMWASLLGMTMAFLKSPIVLIAAAIGIVIAALNHFGFTARDILTFVGGLFGGLVALVVNLGIYFFNNVIILAEFLTNVFIDPVYAVKMLFYSMVENIISFINGLISGVTKGVNWIISKVSEITGIDIPEMDEYTFENPLEKPTSDNEDLLELDPLKFVSNENFGLMGAAFTTSFLREENNLKIPGEDGYSTLMNSSSIDNIGSVDKVNKVGQIDDDVNIADEDLKMLMELAVQNRVNQINLAVQTAAPNVTQNNIINNEMDIQAVANEFATSVYNTSQVMVEQDY